MDKLTPVSIFIPNLNDYVEVSGARIETIDGKQYLRIHCTDTKGKSHLFNPRDLEIFFNRHGVPF